MILHYRDNFDKNVLQMRFFNFFVNFHCFTPDESFDDVITLIMTSSKFFFRQNIFEHLDYICAKFGWYCISGSWFTQGGGAQCAPPPGFLWITEKRIKQSTWNFPTFSKIYLRTFWKKIFEKTYYVTPARGQSSTGGKAQICFLRNFGTIKYFKLLQNIIIM